MKRRHQNILQWRDAAHEVFDKLWSGPTATMSRTAAYRWLAKITHRPLRDAHISRFNVDDCKALIEIMRRPELITLPGQITDFARSQKATRGKRYARRKSRRGDFREQSRGNRGRRKLKIYSEQNEESK